MSTNDIAYLLVNSQGRIVREGVCSAESIGLQGDPDKGEFAVLHDEGISDDTHFWDFMANKWRVYPDKPGPWAEFDFGAREWIDPRTPDSIAAEAAERLFARRSAASLTRLEFAKRVSHPETGIIQPSSGMILLDGEVPPELQGMVSSLPPADQFDLIMDLKGASQFDRLNRFVVEAGRALDLTDEQMDAVFGI